MGKPLSQELKNLIIQKYNENIGYKKIAKTLELPLSTVKTVVKNWLVHKITVALPRSGRPSNLPEEENQNCSGRQPPSLVQHWKT